MLAETARPPLRGKGNCGNCAHRERTDARVNGHTVSQCPYSTERIWSKDDACVAFVISEHQREIARRYNHQQRARDARTIFHRAFGPMGPRVDPPAPKPTAVPVLPTRCAHCGSTKLRRDRYEILCCSCWTTVETPRP